MVTPGIVAAYRRIQDALLPERAIIRRFIADHVTGAAPQRPFALDIGAGADPFRAALTRALPPGTMIVAADITPGDCVGVVADAQKSPFPDGLFSLVAAMHLLQHVDDPRAALAEAARMLTPGGLLLAAYPCCTLQGRGSDLWRWTPDGMERELRRADLTPVVHRSVGGPLYAVAAILASVPGRALIVQRRGWRSGRSPVAAARLALAVLLAAPFHLLARLLDPVDRALWPRPAFTVGGVILARKPVDA